MTGEKIMNLDVVLFNFINKFAGKWKFLDFLAIFFADYMEYVLVFFLVVASYQTRHISLLVIPAFAGLAARFFINEPIYFFYKRKRPCDQIPTILLIKKPSHPSFPSSHASLFFALSFSLLLYSTPLAIFFLITSCLIGFFRIFCGVPWPSDVLAGVGVGFLTYLAMLTGVIFFQIFI